jgi:hypothetical protein
MKTTSIWFKLMKTNVELASKIEKENILQKASKKYDNPNFEN